MAEETAKKKLTGAQKAMLVGAFSVYAIAPTANIPNVITTELASLYPAIDPGLFSYFLTVTNLVAMLGAFLFALMAGKVLKFRTITLIALCLFIIGGAGPMFLPDEVPFSVLVGTRAILGLALGCFTPLAQSVVISLFEKEKTRAYWLGIGGVCFNISITFGSTLAGILALISWKMVFAFYLIGVIPLIIFIFAFKEPIKSAEEEKKTKQKVRIKEVPTRVWIIMICFCLSMLCLGFFTSFGRMAFDDIGVTPTIFGTLMSFRTVGSLLVGAVFGFLYKFLKKYVLATGMILLVIAFAIFYIMPATGTTNLIPLYVAAFSMGFGMNMLTVGMAQTLSILTNPIVMTFVLGLNTLFMNMGTFLSSPVSQVFFGIVGEEVLYPVFLFAMIVCIILAVICWITMASAKNFKAEEVVG